MDHPVQFMCGDCPCPHIGGREGLFVDKKDDKKCPKCDANDARAQQEGEEDVSRRLGLRKYWSD